MATHSTTARPSTPEGAYKFEEHPNVQKNYLNALSLVDQKVFEATSTLISELTEEGMQVESTMKTQGLNYFFPKTFALSISYLSKAPLDVHEGLGIVQDIERYAELSLKYELTEKKGFENTLELKPIFAQSVD